MNYSNTSVYEFCSNVYDLYTSSFIPCNISSLEMYKFLKEKTNNFQKELFDYIISDIRDFIEDVEFEIENPEKEPDLIIDENTGYPTQASAEELSDYQRTIITTIRNLPDYYPIYDDTFFNFKDE